MTEYTSNGRTFQKCQDGYIYALAHDVDRIGQRTTVYGGGYTEEEALASLKETHEAFKALCK